MDIRDYLAPAPLPGTEPPPRALFVDRWGTLFSSSSGEDCSDFDQLVFSEGAENALFRATQASWRIYLLGNEDAVAFGRVSDAAWKRFENAYLEHLSSLGARVSRNYACLDNPEGKGAHAKDSVFLLPNTGALYHAAQHDGIRLDESWVIGDGSLELAAGWRAGCRLARVGDTPLSFDSDLTVDPDLECGSLAEAIQSILASHRMVG